MVGDGTLGWRPYAPYDVILVSAASPQVAPAADRSVGRGRPADHSAGRPGDPAAHRPPPPGRPAEPGAAERRPVRSTARPVRIRGLTSMLHSFLSWLIETVSGTRLSWTGSPDGHGVVDHPASQRAGDAAGGLPGCQGRRWTPFWPCWRGPPGASWGRWPTTAWRCGSASPSSGGSAGIVLISNDLAGPGRGLLPAPRRGQHLPGAPGPCSPAPDLHSGGDLPDAAGPIRPFHRDSGQGSGAGS